MFNFIYLLKLLATALITNSHYSAIWPVSALATGGLLGNVIFFAVSGFCLCRIKDGFVKWYGKRFLRIYPVMALFTLLTVVIGKYSITNLNGFIELFLFPTNYIFIVWILLLYVPFYVVSYADEKHDGVIKWTLTATVSLWLIVYMIFVDKSHYHIDDVNSPFILFLYFASMLIGALFNKNRKKFTQLKIKNFIFVLTSLVMYFGAKIIFSRYSRVSFLQPINQIAIIAALISIFAFAIGLEKILCKLNGKVIYVMKFIASITLQIYIVQFLVIESFKSLVFPLNLVVVTALIVISASILYYIEHYVRKGIGYIVNKNKTKNGDPYAENENK